MSITNVPELFGSMVFNDTVMKERLPKDVYKKMKKTMREGTAIDADVAAVVATAMKDWAISKGATHYTHWFQPMTGITAEKHDSFITPANRTHRPSRPAVCAQPSRHAATPHGTRPATHL